MTNYLISRSITSNTLFDVLKVESSLSEDGVEDADDIEVVSKSVTFEVAQQIVETLKEEE